MSSEEDELTMSSDELRASSQLTLRDPMVHGGQ